MNEIQKLLDNASQNLLINESLTSDLDDESASLVLKWAINTSNHIVKDSFAIAGNHCERLIDFRLFALGKLLKRINKWHFYLTNFPEDELTRLLQNMISEAVIVFGKSYVKPTTLKINTFIRTIERSSQLNAVMKIISFINPQTSIEENKQVKDKKWKRKHRQNKAI